MWQRYEYGYAMSQYYSSAWVNSVAAIWVKEKWVKAAAPWLTSKNNEKT